MIGPVERALPHAADEPPLARAPAERAGAAAFAAEVLAVIVLYGRGLAESPTYRTLDAELAAAGARLSLLVYDNSPDPGPLPALARDRWDVDVVRDPSNPGVSAAYLEGARRARALGKRWLLFFDQDTTLPAGTLAAYAAAAAEHPGEVLLAPVLVAGGTAVSPCGYRGLRGRALPALAPGPQSLAGRSVLNSGMCVDREAYEAAGGHDAAIPLDFSDHELVGRLRRVRASFVVVDATLGHGLSAAEPQTRAGALRRFDAYCRGARRLGRGPLARAAVRVAVSARAARLAWRWRDPSFLRVALLGGARR